MHNAFPASGEMADTDESESVPSTNKRTVMVDEGRMTPSTTSDTDVRTSYEPLMEDFAPYLSPTSYSGSDCRAGSYPGGGTRMPG